MLRPTLTQTCTAKLITTTHPTWILRKICKRPFSSLSMTIASTKLLVVGLGNLPAPRTRHSVGHMIVDALASRTGANMCMNRELGGYVGHSDVALGNIQVSLTLFKPKPLMNISGPSVLNALRRSSRSPEYMVVIHDSLDHRPQTLSYKFGGSAGGHNGVKSVIASVASQDFHRLRVGIGRDPTLDSATYVLKNLPAAERTFWLHGEGLELVWSELERIARKINNG